MITENKQLGWGILGAGKIAQAFALGVAASRTGRLVAIGSRTAQKAQAFQEAVGVPHAHGSYESLLADPDVHAVYIATPHPMHAEWAIKAAEAGKHILCEKPLTLNHAQAMSVLEAAKQAGVFLMEAFMYRCHPQTAKILEIIRSGLIGEIRVIQASFGYGSGSRCDPAIRSFANELGGGGILDVGCYPVSMARLIAGAAQGKDFLDPIEVRGMAHLGETGVDEWAVGLLRFPGDMMAEVATGVRQNFENGVRIFGSAGSLWAAQPWTHNRHEAVSNELVVTVNAEKEPRLVTVASEMTAYGYEVDAFGDALAAGRCEAVPPAMTWADTLGNMKTLDRWREAVGLTYEMEKPRPEPDPKLPT